MAQIKNEREFKVALERIEELLSFSEKRAFAFARPYYEPKTKYFA